MRRRDRHRSRREDVVRGKAEVRPDLLLDFVRDVGIVPEELLRVLAALPDTQVPVAEPRSRFLDDLHLDSEIDELARLRDPLAVPDVELRDAERGGDLVLDDLDLR